MTAEPVAAATPSKSDAPRVDIGGVTVDVVTEVDVLDRVAAAWQRDEGGLIVTPNVDIVRRVQRERECAEILERASLVVADGMPLIWASRLAGTPLPERVAGSSLVESLCGLAGRQGRSVYIVGGGAEGTADRAVHCLAGRYPGLRVAGTIAPPYGFDTDPEQLAQVVDRVVASGADLVLVGLGFPKQERLAEKLSTAMPSSWFLGCGAGVAMAAGETRRPPRWAQRLGAEWLARLIQEPRRLARRYLIDDVPTALALLVRSARCRSSR